MRKPFITFFNSPLFTDFFSNSLQPGRGGGPRFPKVTDNVTITFNATEGNGALTGISPVYAHAGVITSASTSPTDWKYVQGVWGTLTQKC